MSKFPAFIILVALRIFYQPSAAQSTPAGFANPSKFSEYGTAVANARVINVSASLINNRIYVNWKVSENETADVFEIEKSIDGKNFKMAALVFGTDKTEMDSYQFYEKAGNQKWVYRIKVINKDKRAEYSPVVAIIPAA